MVTIIYANEEKCISTTAKTLVNGTVVFTITGGPIEILSLLSVCITANDATASTLQWQSNPTLGTATTFTGATATLASATIGTTIAIVRATLATAPAIVAGSAGGIQLPSGGTTNSMLILDGTITTVVGVGSTTGTWRHFMRYRPLGPDSVAN